ncbi:hypothetical protein KBB96_05695 [Luteolibacter ambystomatis]|uniref:Uncharacterized protein n=1 Tax=Luteolibacter ambystomatis TaxID=2824561 RepID=A0A975J1Q7_9BACT|nr:hypothetical protein [Luteolibacter ambystomatis]QUE52382.1 hypothetical protein KBB96_05695 [Luteolibacter ambystomatis]
MKQNTLARCLPYAGTGLVALVAGVIIGRVAPANRDGAADKEDAVPSLLAHRSERSAEGPANGSTVAGRGSNRSDRSADKELGPILEASSSLERTQRLLAFLERLPADQFEGVYDEFRNNPLARVRESELSLVLQAWADRDPHAALGFLQTKGAQDWERETAVSTWAGKDPQAAFEWAQITPDTGRVNNWVLGAMRGIATTNPDLARDYLAGLEGETRDRSLNALQPYVTQYGFDYAKNWIAGVQDPDFRNSVARNMARDLANLDMDQATTWAASLADADTRRSVAGTLSDAWARTDVNAAKAWVDSLPPEMKVRGVEGVSRYYAQSDPVAAASWLTSMGNGPEVDRAKSIYVEETFRGSPQTSLDFVSKVADKGSRDRLYWRFTTEWARRDPASARQWVNANASRIPQDLVNRLNR